MPADLRATLFGDITRTGPPAREVPRMLPNVPRPENWQPDPIPELRGERLIYLDAETQGLRWWDRDLPVGWAYYLPESGREGYLPMRHPGGFNHPPEKVHEFLADVGRRQMEVSNAETKFDLHMARADGVDLVEAGCSFRDIQHRAALLDDNRFLFGLDQLARDFGATRRKLDLPALPGFLPAWTVSPYATNDVRMVHELDEITQPLIEAEELTAVLDLECKILRVVVEMEKNGTWLDMELLARWRVEARAKLESLLWEIRRETGVAIESPGQRSKVTQIFSALGIAVTSWTETGLPTISAGVLKTYEHPTVAKLMAATQYDSLLSKYLDKYGEAATAEGWLRFNLHQLRNAKDDQAKSASAKRGTVSGRFSGAGDSEGGYNPQQVLSKDKQLERGFCPEFVIRSLFLPGSPAQLRENPKRRWVCSDAKQIEYRLFAHYAADPVILAAYAQDPNIDFHLKVMDILHRVRPDMNRKETKNTNFAKIYGAGLCKFTFMVGCITEAQYEETLDQFEGKPNRTQLLQLSPYAEQFRKADEINQSYDRAFPSVKPLIRRASDTAKQRGNVYTLMKRRARILQKFHSALNRIIQGGAADVNKRVILEAYERRKEFGLTLYLTVHDELDSAMDDPDASLVGYEEMMNMQYFPELTVPILWDTHVGRNWAEAK